jgi:hypothetical protein
LDCRSPGGRSTRSGKLELSIDAAYLAAAILIFLLSLCVKTAPWEWDNIKLLIWAYFITLPILWERLLRRWPASARAGVCIIMFFSGFVSLIGGLAVNKGGYELANRSEVDFVAAAVRRLPVEARFAGFPTYNHPLLLNGRKMVCGYGGHLWTQGINSTDVENKLRNLMLGQGDWKKGRARTTGALSVLGKPGESELCRQHQAVGKAVATRRPGWLGKHL